MFFKFILRDVLDNVGDFLGAFVLQAQVRLEFAMWDPTDKHTRAWSAMSLPLLLKKLNTENTDSSFATCLELSPVMDRIVFSGSSL